MKNIVLIVLICHLSVDVVNAARQKKISIQDRLSKLEMQIQQRPESSNTSNTAELVIENQKLQQQIAELKGVIEEQNYQIQSLKDKQKLLYIDIDSRLSELETNKNPSTGLSANDITDSGIMTDNNVQSDAQSTDPVIDQQTNGTDNFQENTTDLASDKDDYDSAFAHLRAGRFSESARAFEDFIQKYPGNELTDNAYYWLGESYYVKRQYPQALAAFQTLTQQYPTSSKAPDSWLKIGYSYYEMDDFVQADKNLQKVIDDYPNSSIARLAKNRLRQLQRDH